jgi:hypothetical protein
MTILQFALLFNGFAHVLSALAAFTSHRRK